MSHYRSEFKRTMETPLSHVNSSPQKPINLLSEDCVVENHIQAFAEALNADELSLDHLDGASPNIPGTPASPATPHTRVRKVSALSDFAPVNTTVKRRKRSERIHDRRKEWTFLLLRWPLLWFILLFIALEFGFYVVIRQLVNTKEWISAWRGRKGVLRKKLRAARNYEMQPPS